MSEEMIYSFIVHDVSVTMNANAIKSDLMKRYNSVKHVTRMFYDDEDETAKTSVKVDFTSPTDVETINRDGSIIIGGICRRIYAIKKRSYQRADGKPRQYSPNKNKPLDEQDLLNMFEEQKKLLKEVMNSFDDKLNNVITPRQDKTTQPILSNNA